VLYDLMRTRPGGEACAWPRGSTRAIPGNDYLLISQERVVDLLERLHGRGSPSSPTSAFATHAATRRTRAHGQVARAA